MKPTEDYKSRSGAVRSTARSHLALIRQNRIARRTAEARPADERIAAPQPLPPEAVLAEPLRTIESVAAEIMTAAARPAAPPSSAAAPTAMPAAPPDSPPDSPAEAAPLPPRGQRQPAVPADSDLFALPGAGSGLVWMLRSSGIDTMDDLAAADPDRLGAELGLIGQILDISDWIAFARAQVASR